MNERWWWPKALFSRLSIVAFLAVAGFELWSFIDAHTSSLPRYENACRYFQTCEVCVNARGRIACGEATYVNSDLAKREAWFLACANALEESPFRTPFPSLGEPVDPCSTQALDLWPKLGATGFNVMTNPERQCVEKSLAGDLDKLADAEIVRAERVAARADAWGDALGKVLDADAVRYSTVWRVCLATLPRYSWRCWSPEDHREFLPVGYPAEIVSYGQAGAQQ